MDLKETGKFIQSLRKEKGLTQSALALKLGVSEKTISKWECGKGFPDTSLMLPLCNVLGISANELLSAKRIKDEKEYKESAEENLITLKALQETNTKLLLAAEWPIMILSMIILLGACVVVSYVALATVWRVVILVSAFILLAFGLYFGILIETKAGYYECGNCHHHHVPTYKQVLWSMHMGRTRHMKCPKCGERSWQKKRIYGE